MRKRKEYTKLMEDLILLFEEEKELFEKYNATKKKILSKVKIIYNVPFREEMISILKEISYPIKEIKIIEGYHEAWKENINDIEEIKYFHNIIVDIKNTNEITPNPKIESHYDTKITKKNVQSNTITPSKKEMHIKSLVNQEEQTQFEFENELNIDTIPPKTDEKSPWSKKISNMFNNSKKIVAKNKF